MGTDQTPDYSMVLADLEAKKAAIEAAISSLKVALGMGSVGPSSAGDLNGIQRSASGGQDPKRSGKGRSGR